MAGTRWSSDYRQQLDDIDRRVRRARDDLAGATGTASGGNGAVTVTVGSFGALQSLTFTDRADEMSRPALAEAIVEASRAAHRAAGQRVGDALGPLVGSAAADRLVADYAPVDNHGGGSDGWGRA